MNNQTFENVFSFFNEVVETLDTKEETDAIKKTQLAIQELEKLREKQKNDSKNTLKVLVKKLENTKENTNHTLKELEELRQSRLLNNLENENNQLEKENSELEKEIKQLQIEYDELLIEEKKLELKEKKEEISELDPTLLKIGVYRGLGIEAIVENNGLISKCHIHNSNTNNNHTIFFPNSQDYIQQPQQSVSFASTNLLWNLCTSKNDNELINMEINNSINNIKSNSWN
ncbi:hypothetical protein BCR32DRAFT_328800, partial [Anaeromyces robustus]